MPNELLLFTEEMQAAIEEIQRLGGRVTHQFTPTVLVAMLPDSVRPESLEHARVERPISLDAVSELAAGSWKSRSEKAAFFAAPDPTIGLSWDAPGYKAPRNAHDDPDLAIHRDEMFDEAPDPEKKSLKSTGTPTSLYMIGSIAVGVVMVSGKGASLSLSKAEKSKILLEVQEGLNFLANAEPYAGVTFVYDIHDVEVDAAPHPDPVHATYEECEAPWRNPALQQLGYSGSYAGIHEYASALRTARSTQWSYVVFFTKYPLHHFAYAGGARVCMEYSNDGWGPDNINAVFAHETCHIFGAADEYGSCACGGAHGQLGAPNNNCVRCFPPGAQVPCLMNANTLTMCGFSRKQIGWDQSLFPIKQSSGVRS